MHIALISTCALATPPTQYGGTELVVADLVNGLVSLGHEVAVYATGDSSARGDLRSHFERPVWPPNDLAELRHAGFAWKDIAKEPERFDVVHVHHSVALPFHSLVHLPTVMTLHHARDENLIDHYGEYPDVHYVAISSRQAQLSPEVGFADIIHHGLDPARYAAGDGSGNYVAFLGRFAPEKGTHIAIDAASDAGVRLLLAGVPHEVPAARAYFEQKLERRLRAAENLEWCGEVSHGPKLELLRHARGLLMPLCWEEPFGLVMIEAMLVGTPVIAFARGSAPEIVEEGLTGFLVHTTSEMTDRIRQLDRIARVRCRARAQERWSARRMAQQYAGLYAQLSLEKRSPACVRTVSPSAPPREPIGASELATSGTKHGADHR